MSWAKLPTHWIAPVTPPETDAEQLTQYPLSQLRWVDYKGSGLATFMVLMAISIRLNQAHQLDAHVEGSARKNFVAVTYDDLQDMTGFARATIGKAISHLESFQAVRVEKKGRINIFHLKEVDEKGAWRKLPQRAVLTGAAPGRLIFKTLPRNRVSFNAIKLYLALIYLVDAKRDVSSISYNGITRWTGIRGADIGPALGVLASLALVRPSFERDERHAKDGDNDQSQRYWVAGLSPWNSMAPWMSFSEETGANATS